MHYLCNNVQLSCARCNHPAKHTHIHTHTHKAYGEEGDAGGGGPSFYGKGAKNN